MIIDFSAHHISKRVGEYIRKADWYGPGTIMEFPAQNADPEVHLEDVLIISNGYS